MDLTIDFAVQKRNFQACEDKIKDHKESHINRRAWLISCYNEIDISPICK